MLFKVLKGVIKVIFKSDYNMFFNFNIFFLINIIDIVLYYMINVDDVFRD